jgi:branched-chain amino acid transport system ATP-binding protein
MTGPVLAVHGLAKNFGGLAAVRGVDMTIAEREICGLIGPNGAGKSTVFNLIAGELPPSAGSIRLGATEIAGLPSHAVARRGVSRAFQLVHLFGSMTALENVMVGAQAATPLGIFSALTHVGGFHRNERAIRRRADADRRHAARPSTARRHRPRVGGAAAAAAA